MTKALIKLHISIILAGFTGLFGKWVDLTEVPLVWWRLALVVGMMYPFFRLTRQFQTYPLRETLIMFGVGALQCLHWVLFYASIRESTVSVALVCISLMGFFSAVFSPLILHTRWSLREFVFSGISILGIALIFHFDSRYRLGIGIGVISSAVASLFVVCNKKIREPYDSGLLFLYEMMGGLLFLTAAAPLLLSIFPAPTLVPHGWDWGSMVVLALVCTIILYVIQLQALERVSAFTVNLSLNLEPVYSIILASLFLGESKDFTASFYLGLALIILSVLLQTLAVLRESKTRRFPRPSARVLL